jgi:putative transcriptional regulator
VTTLPRPDDETLLRHAAGRLDAGFSLVIETHLALSPETRKIFAQFEAIGGLLLEERAPAPAEPSALNAALAALAALDCPAKSSRQDPQETLRPPDLPADLTLPRSLLGRKMGGWRWIAPGVRSRRVEIAPSSISRAFLLELAPGVRVPRHGHEGREMTCVLRGSFIDRNQRYPQSSFSEADENEEHDIFVDSATPCISLVALEGRTRPTNWAGRLYQRVRGL